MLRTKVALTVFLRPESPVKPARKSHAPRDEKARVTSRIVEKRPETSRNFQMPVLNFNWPGKRGLPWLVESQEFTGLGPYADSGWGRIYPPILRRAILFRIKSMSVNKCAPPGGTSPPPPPLSPSLPPSLPLWGLYEPVISRNQDPTGRGHLLTLIDFIRKRIARRRIEASS